MTTSAPGRVGLTYDGTHRTFETIDAMAVAPDGSLFTAGRSGRSGRLAVTAFKPDGSLDQRFGHRGGVVVPRDVTGGRSLVRTVNGSLIAVGPAGPEGRTDR